MVGYNQNQPDVWGSFAGGLEIGGALRRRQQQDAYGEAYQQNGFEGVRDAAGGFGDIQTAQSAQGTMDEQEETALARATRSATVMANAASSLQGVPYEQRWQMLDRMEPMLEPLGISPEQLRQFDPTDENLAMIMSMPSEFEQFTEIRNAVDGAVLGIRRNGQTQVLREAPPPAWQRIPQDQLPAGARFGQRNTRTGEEDLDWAPQGGSGGAAPSGYRWTPDGNLEPIPGGPRDPAQRPNSGFGPDQRARAAITYQNALESAQTIDNLEDGGYSLSDDWGAVAVEGMGGGDPNSMAGGVARTWGGEDYQQARAAMSSFESAMLPILSGAAVTESEAIRTIRGALPQVGDGPEVTAQKRRRRQQMLNGAALIYGTAPPFPELGVPPWAQRYLDTLQGQTAQQPDAATDTGIPNGVTPEEWNEMTPQERALFQQ